jgi:hypothetical protein
MGLSSPAGTAENIPGHPSWVRSTDNRNRGRRHISSRGNGGFWVVARTRQPHIGIPGLTSWDILSRPGGTFAGLISTQD